MNIEGRSCHDAFCAARRRGKATQINEQNRVSQNRPPWGAYDEGISMQDLIFKPVHQGGLTKFVKEHVRLNRPVYALHLLGGTQSLRDLNQLSGGVAVTLNDFRSKSTRLLDEQKQIELITGDVFSGRVWAEIASYLQGRQRSGFELIYSSPLLGWNVLGHQPEMFWLLLDLAWRVLAEDGALFIETLAEQSIHVALLVSIFQKKHLEAFEKDKLIFLKKRKGDPPRLPKANY